METKFKKISSELRQDLGFIEEVLTCGSSFTKYGRSHLQNHRLLHGSFEITV
jgi:hypothetical protein